jgi:hypothetical protein
MSQEPMSEGGSLMNQRPACIPDDQLDWLAFRYIAGELTADDEELFEQRLAEDQTARDAVDQAVELQEAIRLASSEAASDRGGDAARRIRRRVAWAAAAAASLALLFGLSWTAATAWHRSIARSPRLASPQGDLPAARISTHRNAPASDFSANAEVARAWVALRRGEGDETRIAETPTVESIDSTELGPGEFGPTDVADAECTVPNWMLTAVSVPSKRD